MTITHPSPTVGLDAEELHEFERALRKMLDERVPPASGDAIGEARHRAQTRALHAALERIADGTFGACRWCGSPIGVARLEVVPTAQGCMTCTAGRR